MTDYDALARKLERKERGYQRQSVAELIAEEIVPPGWLVANLVQQGPAVGGLFGAEKNGKSLAGLQLCFAVALGHKFLGIEVENRGPTLFIEYEGSKAALKARAVKMAAQFGVLATNPDISVIHRPSFLLDTDEGEAWLTEECQGSVLCVVGPVAKACAFRNENDSAEWSALFRRLARVADVTGCTILLVHHLRKPDRQFGRPSKVVDFFNSSRGSNAFAGAVDCSLGVQRDPDDTEGTLFYMERDGFGGRIAYDFDVKSLCIFPSNRAVGPKTTIDKASMTLEFIEAHPDCSIIDIAKYFGVTDKTAKSYVKQVADEVEAVEHPRNPDGTHAGKTYRRKTDVTTATSGNPLKGGFPAAAVNVTARRLQLVETDA